MGEEEVKLKYLPIISIHVHVFILQDLYFYLIDITPLKM